MLSLPRRPRRGAAARRSVRLELEALEARDCPTAPVITTMSFTELPQRVVRLSGTVADDHNVSAVIVNFTGVVNGSTTVNAAGGFVLQATASALGKVSATAYDPQQQLTSAPYALLITSNPPAITNFSAVENPDGSWTFSGYVTDAAPQGEVVNFGGLNSLQNKTARANSFGYFTLTVTLQPGEQGTATALATDWWGQASNLAQFAVFSTDPTRV
jgi:hypothetical protein